MIKSRLLPYGYKMFEIILARFKRFIGCDIKEIELNKYEKVLVVNDNLVLYCLFREQVYTAPFKNAEDMESMYSFFNYNISLMYNVLIEELTPNKEYKFNNAKFNREFPKYSMGHCFYYKRFEGWNSCVYTPSFAEYVNKKLPELKIKERALATSNVKYSYLVFELDFEGKKEPFVWRTDKPITEKVIDERATSFSLFLMTFEARMTGYFNKLKEIKELDELRWLASNNLKYDFDTFLPFFHNIIKTVGMNKIFIVATTTRCFTIEKTFSHLQDSKDYVNTIIANFKKGQYDNVKKFTPQRRVWKIKLEE